MELDGETWIIGEKFDEGGFGYVCAATSPTRGGAVKFIPKARGVSRELLYIEALRGLPNIMPVWDVGETTTHWALLMPRAEKSLAQHIVDRGPLPEVEVVVILHDILNALIAFSRKGVIHRDLKPANILLWQTSWHVSDFGIARYIEATTVSDTYKYSTTPAYRAPEQWRGEQATNATDIYSVGVTAYALLTGYPPFTGPDYRTQHIEDQPRPLPGVSSKLAHVIDDCLSKEPSIRPSAESISKLFQAEQNINASGWLGKLQATARQHAEHANAESAKHLKYAENRERRARLFAVAVEQREKIWAQVETAICGNVRGIRTERRETLTLGGVKLHMGSPRPELNPSSGEWVKEERIALSVDSVEERHRIVKSEFEVIAVLDIAIFTDGFKNRRYHHSLWFSNAGKRDIFQWLEVKENKTPPWIIMKGSRLLYRTGAHSRSYELVSELPTWGLEQFIESWAERFVATEDDVS